MQPTDAIPEEGRPRRLSPAWIASGAVAILVVALLVLAIAQKPAAPPQIGSQVPDFQLTAFDGSPMRLSDQRGHVTVVNFFASWCDPCRQEAANVEQAWRDYGPRGVRFFGIGYKDAASKAKAFLDEFGAAYPATVEPGNRTARAYGVTGVPETFIIDQAGRLVDHVVGAIATPGAITKEELYRELDQLLSP